MKSFIKTFPKFINENWRQVISEPTIANEYKTLFGDFSFEKNIPKLITTVESHWINLKEKYNWNYSDHNVSNKDHFALNVKINVWPDADKVRELLEDPDLSKEVIGHNWNSWLNERAEMFIEHIQLHHAWITATSFAGRSGGWLFIYPGVDDEDWLNSLEELCKDYQKEKETLTAEEIEAIKKYDHLGEYSDLVDVGLVGESEDFKYLEKGIRATRELLNAYLLEMKQMDMDLTTLTTRIAKFKLTAEDEFYQYLKDDFEFNR